MKHPRFQIQSLTGYTRYLILIKIKHPQIRIVCMYINNIIRSEFLLDLPYANNDRKSDDSDIICGFRDEIPVLLA
jgi:hypothetical protein